jgi:hypothetical protein
MHMIRQFLLIAAGCLTATGCSAQRATVTGKVSHAGKPVTSGGVTLIASDNIAYSGTINRDGTYTIPNVPSGPVKIGVTSPNSSGGSRGKGGGGLTEAPPGDGAPAGWFPLPDKCRDPLQSGLTGTVDGKTPLDINIP